MQGSWKPLSQKKFISIYSFGIDFMRGKIAKSRVEQLAKEETSWCKYLQLSDLVITWIMCSASAVGRNKKVETSNSLHGEREDVFIFGLILDLYCF